MDLVSSLPDTTSHMDIVKILMVLTLVVMPALAESPVGFEVDGLLVPVEQARIASRARGLIAKVASEGERVSKGQPLLELEKRMEELQIAQQRQLVELRTLEWDSHRELLEKKVVGKNEAEQRRVGLEIARSQLAQTEHLLEQRSVLAPFDGVVVEQLRHVGEAVEEFTPVVHFVNPTILHLEVFLPASQAPRLREGQRVVVKAGDTLEGTIEKLTGTVNAASGEFKVRIRVPNADGRLLPGTTATAVFPQDPS